MRAAAVLHPRETGLRETRLTCTWVRERRAGPGLDSKLRTVLMVSGLLLGVAYWALLPSLARAQGTDVQRFRETAGAYEISMALVQSSLSLGTTLLAITVVEAANGQPVPDARVVLKSRQEAGDGELKSIALNTPSNPDRYDAMVNLDAPGTWNLAVEVDSSLGRVSVEMAQLEVPETRSVTGGTYVFIGVFIVLIAGVAYVWWSAQRARRRRDQQGGGGAQQESP